MSLSLALAQTPEELEKVFRLRYRVYIEQENRFKKEEFPTRKIQDAFDAHANTKNILVYSDGVPIGTVRYTLDTGSGLPADAIFDFASHRTAAEGPYAGVGMLAVLRGHRQMSVFFSVIKLLAEISSRDGVRWLLFPLNVEMEPLLRRFGAQRLASQVFSDRVQNHIVPMRMGIDEIWTKYKVLFEVMDRLRLSDTYRREVFKQGDMIIRKGDPSGTVYYIARGKVLVTASDYPIGAPKDHAVTINAGGYIGELGVMNRAVRSANVIADDVEVELVVIPADAFLGELQVKPELMQQFFHLLFERTGLFEGIFATAL